MPRLDAALFARNLASSRTHARRIVEEGRAHVNGSVARKPSMTVAEGDVLEVLGVPEGGEFASRAALKLEGTLERLGARAPQLAGARVLDLGLRPAGFPTFACAGALPTCGLWTSATVSSLLALQGIRGWRISRGPTRAA